MSQARVLPKYVATAFAPPPAVRIASALMFAIMVAALFYGSAAPTSVPALESPWDKLAHLVYFAALAVLFVVATGTRSLLTAVIVVGFVGMADELVQSTVPYRDASWVDFAADLIGASVAVAGFAWLDSRRRR